MEARIVLFLTKDGLAGEEVAKGYVDVAPVLQ